MTQPHTALNTTTALIFLLFCCFMFTFRKSNHLRKSAMVYEKASSISIVSIYFKQRKTYRMIVLYAVKYNYRTKFIYVLKRTAPYTPYLYE